MTFPALPIFEMRQPAEDAAGFGLRLLLFVVAHDFTPGTVSPDALDLACHASGYAYTRDTTPGTAEAVNRAVTLMRASAAQRRAAVRASLLALGFTDEPTTVTGRFETEHDDSERAGSGPAPFLNADFSEIELRLLKAFAGELVKIEGDADSGHKVKVRKPKPAVPPAGCAAPF